MKRNKAWILSLLLVLSVFLFAGCRSSSLPEGVEKDDVEAAGLEILELLKTGEYQAVADAFRADLKEQYAVDADKVAEIMNSVAEAGAFEKISERKMTSGKNDSFSEPYSIAIFYCEHAEEDVVYEMSFDADLTLIGFQVKQKCEIKTLRDKRR